MCLLDKKYCSKACQIAHWPLHRVSCNSPLSKKTWLPNYIMENRSPDWLDGENMMYWKNFAWGESPGFDCLKLEENEGADWDKNVDLCFIGKLR